MCWETTGGGRKKPRSSAHLAPLAAVAERHADGRQTENVQTTVRNSQHEHKQTQTAQTSHLP